MVGKGSIICEDHANPHAWQTYLFYITFSNVWIADLDYLHNLCYRAWDGLIWQRHSLSLLAWHLKTHLSQSLFQLLLPIETLNWQWATQLSSQRWQQLHRQLWIGQSHPKDICALRQALGLSYGEYYINPNYSNSQGAIWGVCLSLCPICLQNDKSIPRLFVECLGIFALWSQLAQYTSHTSLSPSWNDPWFLKSLLLFLVINTLLSQSSFWQNFFAPHGQHTTTWYFKAILHFHLSSTFFNLFAHLFALSLHPLPLFLFWENFKQRKPHSHKLLHVSTHLYQTHNEVNQTFSQNPFYFRQYIQHLIGFIFLLSLRRSHTFYRLSHPIRINTLYWFQIHQLHLSQWTYEVVHVPPLPCSLSSYSM